MLTFSSLPPAAAVANFHSARPNQPMWLADRPAVNRLIAALQQSPIDGFAVGPRLAPAIEQALNVAEFGNATQRLEAERLISAAWVMYVQALHWPGGGMAFADQSLAPKIPSATLILANAARSASLAEHVASVSQVNPLYAQLRTAALRGRDTAVSPAVKATLDRARSLPATGRYILVDLASQRLWMMENGRPADFMKVVVGRPDMQTPMIAGTISAVTLNPYWNVPADLARKNIAPRVLRNGAAYLRTKGYEVLSDWSETAAPVDPRTVDWHAVSSGRAEVRLRQKPGPGNMMGAMKFEFPNRQGIYLHDTPDKSLFQSAQRTFSSGCVRLEDAAQLGRWLMGGDVAAIGSTPEQQIKLPRPVPVFITYLTAQVEHGAVTFAHDVYGLDGLTSEKLAQR